MDAGTPFLGVPALHFLAVEPLGRFINSTISQIINEFSTGRSVI
jgi:hypothetical protein